MSKNFSFRLFLPYLYLYLYLYFYHSHTHFVFVTQRYKKYVYRSRFD